MAYSTNPNLPRARGIALQLLIRERLPIQVVANRCGVHRSTIWRWKRKWDTLNEHVQLTNDNRPHRETGAPSLFRQAALSWQITTDTSRPHTSPTALSESVVRLVLETREQLKRCAEIVWHYVTTVLAVRVSLSSVRRVLKRHHCFDGARKPRVRRDNPRRPHVTRPGELVETDTIHHVDPRTGRRLYYYTVIDLYTRMTYATVLTCLRQGLAVQAVLEAQASFGFPFAMMQSDNGPEYGRYFEQRLRTRGIQTRHTRLHRPNDNAHIERFNRTIQEECIGHYWNKKYSLKEQQDRLNAYLAYYNHERVHLSLQLQTPSQMLQWS